MTVKAENLENAERDLELTNRDPRGSKKVAADIERMKHGTPTAEEELRAMRTRIAALQATVPQDERPHCADCFRRGWAAALRALKE